MTKLYEFKDESWWESPGCGCCDDILFESYNCTSHQLAGSQDDEDDCYISALQDSGVIHEDDNSVYNLSLNQLKRMCVDNDIMVVIYV